MFHGVRPIAMNLQPGERFAEDVTMEQGALRTQRCAEVEEARLQREDLLETLDVAPRHLQHAQLDAAFERVG
jgi:hypothetical protein